MSFVNGLLGNEGMYIPDYLPCRIHLQHDRKGNVCLPPGTGNGNCHSRRRCTLLNCSMSGKCHSRLRCILPDHSTGGNLFAVIPVIVVVPVVPVSPVTPAAREFNISPDLASRVQTGMDIDIG